MAARKTKIAAVSYLNTVPLVYGIDHAGKISADLLLCPPADCARAYLDKKVDVALVPSGALERMPDAEIVTSFCIGAQKSVRTVTLMSNAEVDKIKTIYLDSHSMTSALLVRILAAELWHITPEWKELSDCSIIERGGEADGFLLIGDKVFDYESRFSHSLDLADSWRELTGLPFVFAVWVARQGTDPLIIEGLEQSLEMGVERIWEAIVDSGHSSKDYAYGYLTENIDYLLDQDKRRALELFRSKGRKLSPRTNPG